MISVQIVFFFLIATQGAVLGALNVACAPGKGGYTTWTSLYGSAATIAGPITIESGKNVLLNAPEVTVNGGITIESGASLTFDWQQDIDLTTAFIIVKGTLNVGSESCPFENKATITLTDGGNDLVVDGMPSGRKGIITGVGAVLELHGAKGLSAAGSWTTLGASAARGSKSLTLTDNVASKTQVSKMWTVGDKIVIATTDWNPSQTEELTITAVESSNVITVDPPLAWNHFGKITFGVDERAEVALLTRNILIQGSKSASNPNMGGHIMVHKGIARVRIQGVELNNMGQDIIGRYPIHMHRIGNIPANSYVRFNTVHDSNFRCFVLHATNQLKVESNVGYNAKGHCFYLEDGVEENNEFVRNLALNIKPKPTGEHLGSDISSAGLSGFWITAPNNHFTDNVAAAVTGTGFWVITRMGPRGDSYSSGSFNNVVPSTVPMGKFDRNKAHSSEFGFQIEATDFDWGDSPKFPGAFMQGYHPMKNGKIAPPVINDFVAYKINDRGVWARTESVTMLRGVFGDNWVGVELATGGSHPPAPSMQWINQSTFVGLTENVGDSNDNGNVQYWVEAMGASFPRRGDGFMGWRSYDGGVGCSQCTFKNYKTYTGVGLVNTAIGGRRANANQVATTNMIRKSDFEDVDTKYYLVDHDYDGGKCHSLRDADGSVSGKTGTLLPLLDFYKTSKCIADAEYDMVCPHKYSNMWVMDMARGPTNNKLRLTRNIRAASTSATDATLTLTGFADYGKYRWQPIVSPGNSYLVSFSAAMSPSMAFELTNSEQGEYVTLAVCYPLGTTITRVSRGLANANGINTLPTLDGATALSAATSRAGAKQGDSYYWDAGRGLLSVTVKQRKQRTDYGNFCPWEGCDFIWVDAAVGGGTGRDCLDVAYSGDSLLVTSDPWLDKSF